MGGTALQAETIMGNFTEGVAPGYSGTALQIIKDRVRYTTYTHANQYEDD